jgi:hypothetical protein
MRILFFGEPVSRHPESEGASQLFEHSCSACHGATLEGTAGAPALGGASWKERFGGAKLLAVWGEIKGPMAHYANVTLSTQQSLDILAFLLQQNGLPAGKNKIAAERLKTKSPGKESQCGAALLGKQAMPSAISAIPGNGKEVRPYHPPWLRIAICSVTRAQKQTVSLRRFQATMP